MKQCDRPAVRRIIEAIEKYGPMSTDELAKRLGVTKEPVRAACEKGRDMGYLTSTLVEVENGPGRKSIHSRTEKIYQPHKRPMTAKERARRDAQNQRAKEAAIEENEKRAKFDGPFVPFRHPFDELFYGEARFSGESSAIESRIICSE
jgi:predicted ArsR family transcriptional regulator